MVCCFLAFFVRYRLHPVARTLTSFVHFPPQDNVSSFITEVGKIRITLHAVVEYIRRVYHIPTPTPFMMLVNLDETNAVLEEKGGRLYLSSMLTSVLAEAISSNVCINVILTGTRALDLQHVISASGSVFT